MPTESIKSPDIQKNVDNISNLKSTTEPRTSQMQKKVADLPSTLGVTASIIPPGTSSPPSNLSPGSTMAGTTTSAGGPRLGKVRIKYPHVIDKKWATVPFPKMKEVDVLKFALTFDNVQQAYLDPKSALKDRTRTRSDDRTSKASLVSSLKGTTSCKHPYLLSRKLPDGSKVKLDESPAADTHYLINQYQEVHERKKRTTLIVVCFLIIILAILVGFIFFVLSHGRGRQRILTPVPLVPTPPPSQTTRHRRGNFTKSALIVANHTRSSINVSRRLTTTKIATKRTYKKLVSR